MSVFLTDWIVVTSLLIFFSKSSGFCQGSVTQLFPPANRFEVSDFAALLGVSRVLASDSLLYLTATSRRYYKEMETRRRMRTRGICKEPVSQRCAECCIEFSPSLYILYDPIFYLNTIRLWFAVVTEFVSGRFHNSSFSSSPLETTCDHKDLPEGRPILNTHSITSWMESKSFFDWSETMDQQSRFQFDLEQDRRTTIHTINNLFANFR